MKYSISNQTIQSSIFYDSMPVVCLKNFGQKIAFTPGWWKANQV